MTVTIVAATPYRDPRSRTRTLAELISSSLIAGGTQVRRVDLARLDLNALATAGTDNSAVADALGAVRLASAVVLVTPIYQASHSGLLKLFLDALPRRGLAHATALPVGCAGSAGHLLALSYSLTPVLQALGAHRLLPPYCAGPDDWRPGGDLDDQACARLHDRLLPLCAPSRRDMSVRVGIEAS